jgi:nucleoside permease NupC
MGPIIVGLVFLPIVYFLPSTIAILRRNRIAEVLVVNTFLGWTFFGWFYSLTAALSTKTHIVISPTVVTQPPIQPMVSPDGNFWWDGSVWQPMYR